MAKVRAFQDTEVRFATPCLDFHSICILWPVAQLYILFHWWSLISNSTLNMRMDLVHSRKKWRFYVDELGPRKYLSSSCSPSQALPCHQLRRLHAGMAPVIRQPLCATPRVQQSAVSNSVVCGSPGLSPHFQPLRHARSPETPPPLPWAAWRQMTDALLQVLKWWNPMSFFWFGHAYSIHFNPIRISQVHGGPQFIIDPRDWGFAEPCCFACSSSS